MEKDGKERKKNSVFFITKQKKEMGKKMNNEREKRENVCTDGENGLFIRSSSLFLESFVTTLKICVFITKSSQIVF